METTWCPSECTEGLRPPNVGGGINFAPRRKGSEERGFRVSKISLQDQWELRRTLGMGKSEQRLLASGGRGSRDPQRPGQGVKGFSQIQKFCAVHLLSLQVFSASCTQPWLPSLLGSPSFQKLWTPAEKERGREEEGERVMSHDL